MKRSYPIVEQRRLTPRGRLGGLLRRLRTGSRGDGADGLAPHAHEALIYTIGGRHVHARGRGGRPPAGAGAVSVVDLSRDAPVTVELQGAGRERVAVTFACTVHDPVAVVRDGLTEIGPHLLAHLDHLPLAGDAPAALVRAHLALVPFEAAGMSVIATTVRRAREGEAEERPRWRHEAAVQESRRRTWTDALALAREVDGDPLVAMLAGHLQGGIEPGELVAYLREERDRAREAGPDREAGPGRETGREREEERRRAERFGRRKDESTDGEQAA
ncbi:hypothetical protein [Nonomuraea typhae]|uniref:Uncharacterized protein n=1 Tax=Nonomuraea typhae TaxID=2603600 RepID=A0ABW7YKW3_9ACTN